MTVIQTIALLHQRLRGRDDEGRIIATVRDDYAEARWLLEEVFTTTVNEGVTPAVRQTVEAVIRLSSSGSFLTETRFRAREPLPFGLPTNSGPSKPSPFGTSDFTPDVVGLKFFSSQLVRENGAL